MLLFFLSWFFPWCPRITGRFPSAISVALPSDLSPLHWTDEKAKPERKGGSGQRLLKSTLWSWEEWECMGYAFSPIYASPPLVLTKPLAEGHRLLQRKTSAQGVIRGSARKKKNRVREREEGWGKNKSQGIKNEPGQKFHPALVSDMASPDRVS